MNYESIDPKDNGRAKELLSKAKSKEKALSESLVRVETLNGHVMTNNPEKWDYYNKENKI